MSLGGLAFFVGAIAALCATLWGLVARQRSSVVGVIAASVALLAAVGAWYAWAESQSTPGTVGYGVVVALSVASAIRQWTGGASRKDP